MRALAAAALLALVAACGGPSPSRATAAVRTAGGEVTLTVEVADTPEERRRGLMGRPSLPERAGMLFIYPEDVRGGFWMKGTLIPLSIAFLDGTGRILRILDMEPCHLDPCPVYRAGLWYRKALEVNKGAYERLGIAVGNVVSVGR